MLSSPNRSGSNRRRLIALAGSALAAVAVLAPAGLAGAAPTPSQPAGHIGGIVPVHGNSNAASGVYGSGNLMYHGGPVMHTNTVYVIYWQPPGYNFMSGTYQSTINQFLADLNASKFSTGNVYSVATQYGDNSGHLTNSTTFLSSQAVVDNDVLPTSACKDNATTVCLSDGQIQSEIRSQMGQHGWTAGPTNVFMLLTARGIGSCDSSSSCAFTQYCAYHGAASGGLYYANMPYADTVPSACDSGQYPNGDAAADSEINLLTHEHNETITDQGLNAWFDRRGYEDGDKCAWNFGNPTVSNGSEYNQAINGHHYYVQQEYSNAISGCALHA